MKQTILAALAGLLLAHQALAETLPMPVEKLGEVQGVPFYKGYGSSIDADPQNPNRFYGLTAAAPMPTAVKMSKSSCCRISRPASGILKSKPMAKLKNCATSR